MNRATTFNRKDLFSQPFPQFAHGFHDMLGSGGCCPLLAKTGRLTRTKQVGGLKPAQESVEIRKQLNSFTVLDWTRVQKIQGQMVAEEEEPVFPVGLRDWFGQCHRRALRKSYNTANESLYRLAHLILWMHGSVVDGSRSPTLPNLTGGSL